MKSNIAEPISILRLEAAGGIDSSDLGILVESRAEKALGLI